NGSLAAGQARPLSLRSSREIRRGFEGKSGRKLTVFGDISENGVIGNLALFKASPSLTIEENADAHHATLGPVVHGRLCGSAPLGSAGRGLLAESLLQANHRRARGVGRALLRRAGLRRRPGAPRGWDQPAGLPVRHWFYHGTTEFPLRG